MPSEKKLVAKKKQVDALVKELKTAESIVLADYKGLTVAQDTEMRAEFRRQGLAYKVVKNSITERAFEQLGIQGMEETLVGPTAIAYSADDVVLAPRMVRKYSDKFRKMTIKGGIVGSEVYSLDHIMQLSRIESRESLYGQLLFMMLYPLTAFTQVAQQIADKGQEAGVDKVADLVGQVPTPAPQAEEAAPAAEAEIQKEEETEGAEESPTSQEEEKE